MSVLLKRKNAVQNHSVALEVLQKPLPDNSIPADGHEYLSLVQKQAENTKLVSLVERNDTPSKLTQKIKTNNFETRHSKYWAVRVCEDFRRIKEKVAQQLTGNSSVSFLNLKVIIEEDKFTPSLALMRTVSQKTALQVIEWIIISEITPKKCFWLYALMSTLCILQNSEMSLLRDLVRRLGDKNEAEYAVLCAVVVYEFGQLDLEHLII